MGRLALGDDQGVALSVKEICFSFTGRRYKGSCCLRVSFYRYDAAARRGVHPVLELLRRGVLRDGTARSQCQQRQKGCCHLLFHLSKLLLLKLKYVSLCRKTDSNRHNSNFYTRGRVFR